MRGALTSTASAAVALCWLWSYTVTVKAIWPAEDLHPCRHTSAVLA
jgi:hypothetical protein